MTAFKVPLVNKAQKVTTTLVGTPYVLVVRWCDPSSCWVMDINDQNGDPVLQGVPLVTGSNLLEQFGYLEFGGAMYVQTDNDTFAVPTYDNLGSLGHLYFVTP